jgi:hypothetical protein
VIFVWLAWGLWGTLGALVAVLLVYAAALPLAFIYGK